MWVALAQEGEAWLRWRANGITATMAPVIMGESPWQTRDELLDELLGRGKPREETWPMKRGKQLEPVARTIFEERTGIPVAPACAQHDSFPWLRCSLDGVDFLETLILEIKCPSREHHGTAIRGEVPGHYRWQLVHQCLVTGIPVVQYLSYNPDWFIDSERVAVVEYRPAHEQYDAYFNEALAFWDLVQAQRVRLEDMHDACVF